jgi:hypothetical protein
MSKQELNEKQKAFIEYLFGAMHEGVPYGPKLLDDAAKHAGYTDHWTNIVKYKVIRDAIYEGYKNHVSLYGLEAFSTMLNVMRNPSNKEGKLQLSAAQAVLDASTIPYKGGDQQIEAPNGVIVLPAKKKVEISIEDDDV